MIDWTTLPDPMLRNYLRRYESGGVQSRPTLRFVDAQGRACLAAALCGARSSAEVAPAAAALGHPFHGGVLEQVSRRFEGGHLSAAQAYDACVLELAARRARQAVSRVPETATVSVPAAPPPSRAGPARQAYLARPDGIGAC